MTNMLNSRIQHKYDTVANWTSNNPILLAGEIGIESDTKKMKIGDGTNRWKNLSYIDDSKLDKITTTASYDRAYVVDASGNNTLNNISSNADPSTIVKRDASSRINVASPSSNFHAVNLKYLNTALSAKLDKVTTAANLERAYVIAADGTQNVRNIDINATASTIVKRNSSGQIAVAAPTNDTHASTKKYVDDKFVKEFFNIGVDGKGTLNSTYITADAYGNVGDIKLSRCGETCILSFYVHVANITSASGYTSFQIATLPDGYGAMAGGYYYGTLMTQESATPDTIDSRPMMVRVVGKEVTLHKLGLNLEDGWISGQLVYVKEN